MIKKFIFTALILSSVSFGQIDFEFSGYVDEFPMIQFIPQKLSRIYGVDKSFALNLLRIRVRPVIYLSENDRINIEAESDIIYYQNITGFFSANADLSPRQVVNMKWLLKDDKNISALNFIDRLYYRRGFDWGNVIIGRQRISWGTGRIWNPIDLFNPLNPTTFYKIEKDGADAVSFKYYLGDFSDINIVFNPTQRIGDSNFGVRIRSNLEENDFSVIAGRFDMKTVAGYDFAGNFFDAGIRSEGLYTFENNGGNLLFIAGIDYQITTDFYALAEYHYNGKGKTNKFEYEFDKLMRGKILNVNKNYLALSGIYQLSPLLTSNLSFIKNLNDQSLFAGVTFSYSYSDEVSLSLGTQYFDGADFTEYWYYPNSVYFQAEVYF